MAGSTHGERAREPDNWPSRGWEATVEAAAWLRGRFHAAHGLLHRPAAEDPTVRAAAIVCVVSGVWFAIGPGGLQMLGIQASTPILAGLTAAGMWRLGADRRLPAAASRFW